MRKLLLKIHLYGGLICFWYLIILGTSSLNFNHRFSFMQLSPEPETWTRQVQLTNTFSDDGLLSETLRDSLSLIGWPLPWETWHDSTGVFHFALEHPGKRYVVDYSFGDRVARVQEIRKGFWRIFNAMHGMGSVPNSFFMHAWKWYTRITVVLVVFSVFSGIYLWYQGKHDKKSGWFTLLGSVLVGLAWMLYLYVNG
ncbi:MAG TPA: hypothetical protein VFO54_00885 [Chryseosolibacter sp.]|nr:hypothetical protein [Chryseosolibacter sp.]